MKIMIPTVGTVMTLLKNWSFTLYPESRNFKLYEALGLPRPYGMHPIRDHGTQVTLIPGTDLKVARVFIRMGSSQYDSVTFTGTVNGKRVRFWASLKDVNKMEVSIVNN